MISLDCTELRCPEFTVPVMRLIKEQIKNAQHTLDIVIKTYEKRAPLRVEHLCGSFGWTYEQSVEQGDAVYIRIRCEVQAPT